MSRALAVLALGALGWLLSAAPASAASCGGAVACQCGDTVTSNYVMSADLGPCAGHGLQMGGNARLDCQGFRITGLGNGTEQYGIYLRGDTGAELTGATVQRCEVTKFLHGIRLRAADGNVLSDNIAYGNGNFSTHVGYGFDVAVGSKNNLFQGNTVQGNADEGVHLGSGTGPNQFVGNLFFNNYLEQIYILSSHGNTFIGNTSYGTGSNSLYLKDSSDNYLEGNTFKDRTARVTGDAHDNEFVDNTFVNATLQFRVYDASPDRIPTGNLVDGGSMTHTGTCLRFTETWGNTVADVALACGTQVVSEGTTATPSSNTIVSIPLTSSKLSVDSNSTLSVGWWLDLHVQGEDGAPIAGARVQALDATGAGIFDLTTDANGDVPGQVLLQYVRTGASTTPRTPHTLNTTRDGYTADSRAVQATQDSSVTVVLAASGTPEGGGSGDGTSGGTGGVSGSFSDDFNRLDSTTLGNGWLEVRGDLVLGGGAVRNTLVKGNHIAVLPELGGATQSAAADFTSTNNNTGPRFGVVLRYQDEGNYYLLYRQVGGSSVLRIARVVDGVETELARTAIANPKRDVAFRLGGRATGTTLTLEVGGVPKLSVSDSTFAGGTIGLLLGLNTAKAAHRADNFDGSVQ
jgi:parallel beta-helix repeat protein